MAKTPQAEPPKPKESFRTLITPIAQLTTVLVAVGSLIVWGYRLQDKVDRLDLIVQTLATAPPSGIPPSSAQPNTNPIATACASLAERYSSATISSFFDSRNGAPAIKKLMQELGCMKKE